MDRKLSIVRPGSIPCIAFLTIGAIDSAGSVVDTTSEKKPVSRFSLGKEK
jgi:hypothetical protein